MKAIVYNTYGSPDVLQLKDVPRPTPKENEVLIKVQAAATNPLDWHYMRGTPYFIRFTSGIFKPKKEILGADIAGRVEAVGPNVSLFQPGDAVFGENTLGGFAEYVCVSESNLAKMPANLSYEAAAAVPVAGLTALQGLRDEGAIEAGQQVLINGASGGVGTFAVQIAKSFGAEVTGVCSTRNVELVRSIGADHVIDYTQENFTETRKRYDLIIDNVANHTIADYMNILNPNGRCVVVGFSLSLMFKVALLGRVISKTRGKQIGLFLAQVNKTDMDFLAELLEAGKIVPVIDRCYPLDKVPEAIGYLEAGHARGKVVVTLSPNNNTHNQEDIDETRKYVN